MAKITTGSLKGLIVVVIMGTLFFSMAPSLVYTLSQGIAEFLTMISGNTTLYGSGPASIASIVASNWGYFLVVGALLLVISVASGIFSPKSK